MSENPAVYHIAIKCKSCGAPEKYLKKQATKVGMIETNYNIKCTLCDYEFDIRRTEGD